MAKPTRVPDPSPGETSDRPHRKSLERTTPAITREAPWFAFNASAAPVAADGPSFGPTRFVLGANVPWIHLGLDVGASSARPQGGLHAHPEDAALLRQVFERLREDGVGFARYFVLGDGRAGVRFAEGGAPEGLDGAVFPDLEVVLEAARDSGISLVLVVLDVGWLVPTELADGQVVGGHADTLREMDKRTALLERVLRPLLMRFGDHPAVLAWELLHGADRWTLEPTDAPEQGQATRGPTEVLRRSWRRLGRTLGFATESPRPSAWVSRTQFREFLSDAAALVHRHTHGLATAGVTGASALDLVRGLGLDFYTVDWEPDVPEEALRRAVSDLRLDRPLLVGAFPGRHPGRGIKSMLDTARCAGHGGAFVWSVLQHDDASGYDGQLAQWSRNHADQLYRREVAPPVRAADDGSAPRSESPLVLQR